MQYAATARHTVLDAADENNKNTVLALKVYTFQGKHHENKQVKGYALVTQVEEDTREYGEESGQERLHGRGDSRAES